MTARFFGVVPAMATPFTEALDLDEARVGELCDWYVRSGVHGISVAGSQGEFFSLEPAERLRLIELAMRAGHLAEAKRLSNVFAPLRAAWALGSFPVVIKEAMALAGQGAGPARAPIAALPEAARQSLRSVVEAILAEDRRLAA
jgi:dihydrodipicolinate synthase/N-acetylneuraminate lyase